MMKVELESMPLNIVLALAKAELMSAHKTTNVEVVGVSIDYDYEDDLDSGAPLLVTAIVDKDELGNEFDANDQEHKWIMIWDNSLVGFHTLMRLDQKGNNNNKG